MGTCGSFWAKMGVSCVAVYILNFALRSTYASVYTKNV